MNKGVIVVLLAAVLLGVSLLWWEAAKEADVKAAKAAVQAEAQAVQAEAQAAQAEAQAAQARADAEAKAAWRDESQEQMLGGAFRFAKMLGWNPRKGGADAPFSQALLEQIQYGISYEAVVEKVGIPGALQEEQPSPGDHFRWDNANGAIVMLLFRDNHLVAKVYAEGPE